MEVPAILVILPVGLLFLLSGLVINLLQALLFVLVRPISKNVHRRFNKIFVELLFSEVVWLFHWWAGVKIELHTDSETFHLLGKEHALLIANHRSDIDWLVGWVLAQVPLKNCKEHALLIANHRSDIDWLVGWVLAQRAGCLGSTVAIIKDVLKYLPVIGWSMWFSEYVLVKRRWAKDEGTLKSGFEKLKDFPVPFWLAIFAEGTRFTQAKLLNAQKYAHSKGLPVPKNVLLPRTKGFVLAVKHMRSFIPALYNFTLTVAKDEPRPSMLTLFRGRSSVVKVEIKRHLMSELPESNDDIAQWCRDMFVSKDAFLEKYFSTGTFGSQEIQVIGRPIKSLIVMIVWSCLLTGAAVGVVLWTRLFCTWQGLVITLAVLFVVAIIMQILILFSQSEPDMESMPIKILPQDPMKEILLKK